MNTFRFPERVANVLCLGAHPDDIEIGAAASLVALARNHPEAQFHFVVLSGSDERRKEAEASATALLGDRATVVVGPFADRFVPYDDPGGAKRFVQSSMPEATPDVVFAPQRGDLHQDHRFVADIAGQVCRDSIILGYEIVKFDGGLDAPSVYVQLTAEEAHAKVAHLRSAFPSQIEHHWYSEEAFLGLMTVRGIECNAPEGFAEAFIAPKMVLG